MIKVAQGIKVDNDHVVDQSCDREFFYCRRECGRHFLFVLSTPIICVIKIFALTTSLYYN